ncbi:MAG: hypothetical protein C0485_12730 [Pirellula sp.]|jgi:hypothetical protein|nr:hypothetical protein [Pirellula sp.]
MQRFFYAPKLPPTRNDLMKRESEWSSDEFRLLLSNPELTDMQLSDGQLGRAAAAINWVRSAVHDFHLGREQSILSAAMRGILSTREQKWICPLCRKSL